MGAGGASTGGGGGVGPAGIKTDGTYGTKKDASKASRRNETTERMDGGGNQNGGGNQKSVEQPKVKSQMDNTDVKSDMITAKAPAITEMSDDEIAVTNKRKGRKKTILTSVTGVNEYPTLSRKTLLG